MRFSSNFELDEGTFTKAVIGGNLGGSLIIRYEKFSIRNFLGSQYTQYKYIPIFYFRDVNGNSIGYTDRMIRNFSLQLTSVATYDFNNGWYIGAGAAFSILLKSQINTKGISYPEIIRWSTNHQYRRLSLAAPIVLGYEWKRSSLFLSYSFGITNRNHKEAFIKEREDNLLLGYNLLIGKKNKNVD
jgi:hypothetical protein